jgi:heptosyltransferase-2
MTPRHKKRHQIDYYLGVLEGVGLRTFDRKPALFISPEERVRAGRILRDAGAKQTDGIVGINPGAAFGGAKRWLPERFAELGRRLRDRYPQSPVVIFGGPSEATLGDAVRRDIGTDSINLAGRTTLREAVSLIDRCRLFITNDSGLMHVADALDIPLVAIFGPTNHTTTPPSGPYSRMARVPVPCSPCMRPECPIQAPEDHHRCMRAVTVDHVWREAARLPGTRRESRMP